MVTITFRSRLLPGLQKAHSIISFKEQKAEADRAAIFGSQIGIAHELDFGLIRCWLDQRCGLRPRREPETRITALAGPENFAAASQAKILLGDDEAILFPPQNIQARLSGLG